jgi:glutamyl-tRNA(Gln) amidotransferase subunit E
MRKIVVDGSNTGGFQRTCVVSLGGALEVEGKKYRLEQICLEEDAARKLKENKNTINYRLDRLGIPLIEVTTSPDIHSPKEAQLVAQRIGKILRATGKVKRGLGTIRQDLNISISGGSVIEVKGVQDLNLIPTIIENEANRQLNLVKIAQELNQKGKGEFDIKDEKIEVSNIFKKTENHIIKKALEEGKSVWALKLPGFKGLLGIELCVGLRLGTEMADHARYNSGVGGIYHTDELPSYGITKEEVDELKNLTNTNPDDAIIIVADEDHKCIKALSAVVTRAKGAFKGVPEETRSAKPDGTTRYSRPRPGAARMYPETDVKTISISPERIETIKNNLPLMPEERLKIYRKRYELNEKLASQILDSEYMTLFEELAEEMPGQTTLQAVILTEDFIKLKRDGIPIENLPDEQIKNSFRLVKEGKTVKESLPAIISWLTNNPRSTPSDALKELNLGLMEEDAIKQIIKEKIETNKDRVRGLGMKSFGFLMGLVMAEVRGKASAENAQKLIINILKEEIKQ